MEWLAPLLMMGVVTADLRTVVVVENFNLRSDVDFGLTCDTMRRISIQNVTVASRYCDGNTKSINAEAGMWIITEAQPITLPTDRHITWLIEFSEKNLSSSFTTAATMDEQLITTSRLSIPMPIREVAWFTWSKNRLIFQQQPQAPGLWMYESTSETPSTTSPPTTYGTTQSASTTQIVTTKAPSPLTAVNINVTIGYMQFQTGHSATTIVKKNTAAVGVAVIEGLLLGTILFMYMLRWYRNARLRAAGMYPQRHTFPPSTARNTVYYDNGGTPSYTNNTRPQVPSYRLSNNQPPVRLDTIPPRPQPPATTPTLMVVTDAKPASSVPPAPLNYWPDEPAQPSTVKNILDSDM